VQRIRALSSKRIAEIDYSKYIALKDPVKNLANRMTLCTYAKPEKAQDIVRLSTQKMPKMIHIDKVALSTLSGRNNWIIPLVSKS